MTAREKLVESIRDTPSKEAGSLRIGATNTAATPIRPLAVSPRVAARYLDVGHDAIYRLLGEGRLRSVKLGRRRLIPMAELERFLSEEMA